MSILHKGREERIVKFDYGVNMKQANKAHYLFLNSFLPEKMTGIESSALKRCQLFERQFGITPIYVTFKYDLNYPKVIELFKKLGKISKKFKHVNLYGYYQSYCKHAKKPNKQVSESPSRYFQGINKKNTYSEFYDERGRISHVNYYNSEGQRIQLDNFDRDGHRFRSLLLHPESKARMMEIFYRRDGSVCYTKLFKQVDGKDTLVNIWVYDEHGMIQTCFNKEDDFHTYLLEFYLRTAFKQGETVNIVGDRGRESMFALDRNKIEATLRLFYMVHNFHLNNPNDMNSTIKSIHFFLKNLDSEQVDAAIVLSPQQLEDVNNRCGHPDKVVFIPHTVDHFPKAVPFSSRNPYRVVAVGRLSEEKRHDTMIKAFAKVVQKVPQATLEIFGQGGLKESLQALIEQLNLTNNVFLRDYTNDIYAEFSTAKCSLMISLIEGQPLVMLESLSSGCPVIATDFRYGPALMIESGVNGFVVEKDNDQAFADKIIEILTNEELAETLSVNAYQSVKRFTEEEIAPLWRELMNINSTKA